MNYELQVIIVEVARPKFIADADLRHSLVIGVRAREPMIDILTALEGGTLGLSDPEVLQVACRESRVLISHDRNTMVGHYFGLVRRGIRCPRLIVVSQDLREGEEIEDLVLIWGASSAHELCNQVRWVPL